MSALQGSKDGGEGWIEWGGGECPVGELTLVAVRLREEESTDPHVNEEHTAWQWDWEHNGGCTDIIAYRIHKES